MKSLYQSLRQKELEFQRILDDAAEANERELRRVQKSLQDALATVNQLLGAGTAIAEDDIASPLSVSTTTPIESRSGEAIDPPPVSDPKKAMRSSQSAIAACFDSPSVREFP